MCSTLYYLGVLRVLCNPYVIKLVTMFIFNFLCTCVVLSFNALSFLGGCTVLILPPSLAEIHLVVLIHPTHNKPTKMMGKHNVLGRGKFTAAFISSCCIINQYYYVFGPRMEFFGMNNFPASQLYSWSCQPKFIERGCMGKYLGRP